MSLQEIYKTKIVPELQQALNGVKPLAVPNIEKVVVHVGFGRHTKEQSYIDNVTETLTSITGQVPESTLAKKSISNFKVRQGNVIGARVTLRGKRMYDFVERLISVTLPRVPDFRGLKESQVDEQGNLNIGLKDQIPFPESKPEDIEHPHGVQITIKTTAKNKEQGLILLKALGFPFKETKAK